MRKTLLSALALLLCLPFAALAAAPASVTPAPQTLGTAAPQQASTPEAAIPEALASAPSLLQISLLAPTQTLLPIQGSSLAFTPVCAVSCTPCPCLASQGVCAFRCVGR